MLEIHLLQQLSCVGGENSDFECKPKNDRANEDRNYRDNIQPDISAKPSNDNGENGRNNCSYFADSDVKGSRRHRHHLKRIVVDQDMIQNPRLPNCADTSDAKGQYVGRWIGSKF